MDHRRDGPVLRIGELAGELGLNPKTIRYYEGIGLLPAPRRSPAGYRLYGAGDRERLRFIAKAKAIGLTLREIGEILALRDDGICPCPHVVGLLDHKLAAIDEQLRALIDVRRELAALRDGGTTAACDGAQVCGIIEGREPAANPVRPRSAAHGAPCFR